MVSNSAITSKNHSPAIKFEECVMFSLLVLYLDKVVKIPHRVKAYNKPRAHGIIKKSINIDQSSLFLEKKSFRKPYWISWGCGSITLSGIYLNSSCSVYQRQNSSPAPFASCSNHLRPGQIKKTSMFIDALLDRIYKKRA